MSARERLDERVIDVQSRGTKLLPSAAMASLRPPRVRMTNGTCTVSACAAARLEIDGRGCGIGPTSCSDHK